MVERLVLKNLQQRPSQHVSWTPGARVMIIFLGLINRSLDRSIARATARSLDRSIARSIARSLKSFKLASMNGHGIDKMEMGIR